MTPEATSEQIGISWQMYHKNTNKMLTDPESPDQNIMIFIIKMSCFHKKDNVIQNSKVDLPIMHKHSLHKQTPVSQFYN